MKRTDDESAGIRQGRLSREFLDACRSYILPSASDPTLEVLEVARVDVSTDLRNVTVHLALRDGEEAPRPAVLKAALERAVPFFRRMLAEAVPMKRTPLLRLAFVSLKNLPPSPPPADSASAPPEEGG
ncbi:MAG: ribosome-binding factor A [Planctomycetes bacterium]|nr:ribosome-binding factor A [Planctomycetota bacterium]